MGGDGSTQSIPFEPLVLVVKDVGPVPLQTGRKIPIRAAWLETPESLCVVPADSARPVIMDERPLAGPNTASRPPLERGGGPAIRNQLLGLASTHGRQGLRSNPSASRTSFFPRATSTASVAWQPRRAERDAEALRAGKRPTPGQPAQSLAYGGGQGSRVRARLEAAGLAVRHREDPARHTMTPGRPGPGRPLLATALA
jgi:hypothetical protein